MPRTGRGSVVFTWLAAFSVTRAWVVVAGWVVLALAGLAGAALWLKVDTNPARMINPELDFRRDYEQLVAAFPQLDNNFVVIVEASDPDLAHASALAAVQSFRARPDLFSHVFAPALSPMFEVYGPLWAEPERLERLVGKVREAAPVLRMLAERPDVEGLAGFVAAMKPAAVAGRAPPFLRDFLNRVRATVTAAVKGELLVFDWQALGGDVRPDRPTRYIVVVKPKLDFAALDPAAAAMEEARRIVTDPENTSAGRARMWLTGEAAMNAEEFETVTGGAALAGLASLVIVTLVMIFGLPAKRLVLPALALILAGFAVNAGFATVAVGSLNMISVAFAVLFIGLGVDYAVHFLLRWAEEAGAGASRAIPVVTAARDIGPALSLAAVTTILAFLAFTPTDFTGMAQLGVIAAGGIAIALAGTLTLVPAVLRWLPVPRRWLDGEPALRRPRRPHRLAEHLRTAVTVLVFVLAVASLFLLPQVRFDGDPVNLKDPDSPSVIAFNRLLHDDPGVVYALSALAPDGTRAKALARRLEKLAEVKQARTAESFLPRDQDRKRAILRTMRDVLPQRVRVDRRLDTERRLRALSGMVRELQAIERAGSASPDLRRAAAGLRRAVELFLAEQGGDAQAVSRLDAALFVRFPEMVAQLRALADAPRITLANMDPVLRAWYVAPDGRWRVEVVPEGALTGEAAMRRFAVAVRSVAPHATGAPVEIVGAGDVVSSAMLTATLVALFVVTSVTALVLRSALLTLLVLAPIVLAALLLVGYTVIFDAPFNFANVIVIPLLLGLGVDSAIHYVHRARHLRSGGAVSASSTPRAVMVSALTTIGSFGTLWITPHRGMSSMGELLTVSVALTLLTTLVVLPRLIDWTMNRKAGQGTLDRGVRGGP